jgi:ABC-2 type transport system ATP-binding protein
VFNCSVEDVESAYHEVFVHPDRLRAARALNPISERQGVGHSVLIFEGADREQFAALGDVRTPSIADLFVAVMNRAQGAAQ